MRRNVESVNARCGNLIAIVAGDFLLARSAEIAASLGTEIAALLANTLGLLCEGQVTEVRSAFSTERSEDDYFADDRGKDRRPHGHRVSHRRHHRGPGRARGGRRSRDSDAASAWSSRSATTSSTWSPPTRSSESPPARTSPKGSTPCRCSSRCATRAPAPSSARCSARPSTSPNGRRPATSWRRSGAIADTVAAGQRFVEEATRRRRPASAPGWRSLEDLASSLLEGLPVSR